MIVALDYTYFYFRASDYAEEQIKMILQDRGTNQQKLKSMELLNKVLQVILPA